MSEYNPFENTAPGVSLHEVNNGPAKTAEPAAGAPPANPPYEPYAPSSAPSYQPSLGSAAPAYQPAPYQPTPAPGGVIPDGSSVHYSSGAYAGAPSARYDLAGNPLPPEPFAAAPQSPYAPPQAPYAPPPSPYGAGAPQPGYAGAPAYGAPQAPYGAPQGAWPPPPGRSGSSLYDMQEANTSGQQGSVPPEVERLHWNWGAFFMGRFWCYWHGMSTLGSVIWGVGFAMRFLNRIPSALSPVFYTAYVLFEITVGVFLGLNGHKMAWRNRRFFGGVDEFMKVQRAWLIGGILTGPVLWIAAIIFIISILTASMPSHSISPSAPGSTFGAPAGGDNGDGGTDMAPPAGAPGPSDPSANPMYNGPAAGAPAPDSSGAGSASASADDTPAPTGFHPTN